MPIPSPRLNWQAVRGLPTALLAAALICGATPAPTRAADSGEALRWLADYIRLDTSNPPGNESLATAYFRRLLHAEGIDTRLFVSPSGRESLYARLEARRDNGRSLVLLHHLDVVPPGPGWSHEPFSGDVVDGFLHGRGAVDDKSLGIPYGLALGYQGLGLAMLHQSG